MAETTLGVRADLLEKAMEICPCQHGPALRLMLANDDRWYWHSLGFAGHWRVLDPRDWCTAPAPTALLEKAFTDCLKKRGWEVRITNITTSVGKLQLDADGEAAFVQVAKGQHTLTVLCEAVVKVEAVTKLGEQ